MKAGPSCDPGSEADALYPITAEAASATFRGPATPCCVTSCLCLRSAPRSLLAGLQPAPAPCSGAGIQMSTCTKSQRHRTPGASGRLGKGLAGSPSCKAKTAKRRSEQPLGKGWGGGSQAESSPAGKRLSLGELLKIITLKPLFIKNKSSVLLCNSIVLIRSDGILRILQIGIANTTFFRPACHIAGACT